MNTRESIYDALFCLIKNITWQQNGIPTQFRYSSRYLQSFDTILDGQLPAIFLRQYREPTTQPVLALPIWKMKAQIWIYALAAGNASQPQNYPAQQINPILDSLQTALQGPVPGEKQTLGGLVEHVKIDGDIIMNDPVVPDQQIIILVPVTITTGL